MRQYLGSQFINCRLHSRLNLFFVLLHLLPALRKAAEDICPDDKIVRPPQLLLVQTDGIHRKTELGDLLRQRRHTLNALVGFPRFISLLTRIFDTCGREEQSASIVSTALPGVNGDQRFAGRVLESVQLGHLYDIRVSTGCFQIFHSQIATLFVCHQFLTNLPLCVLTSLHRIGRLERRQHFFKRDFRRINVSASEINQGQQRRCPFPLRQFLFRRFNLPGKFIQLFAGCCQGQESSHQRVDLSILISPIVNRSETRPLTVGQ